MPLDNDDDLGPAIAPDLEYGLSPAEICAAKALNKMQREIDLLTEVLADCREFVDNYVDVEDGDYGEPKPNKAMRLLQQIDEALGEYQ